MAIYYVRNDGNDSNTGTGPAPNQAWQNIQKALGSTSGLVGGDIVYVAPGRYTEYVGVTITSPSSQVRIVGDPSASQFSGITPGVVLWTTMNASGVNITTYLLGATSKNNLSFENFYFELATTFNNQFFMNLATCQNIQFKKCLIDANGPSTNTNILTISAPSGQALNATIDSCIFNNGAQQLQLSGTSGVTDTTVVKNCLFIGSKSSALLPFSLNVNIINNTFFGSGTAINMNPTSSIASTIKNCLFVSCITGAFSSSNIGTTATYCRSVGTGGFNNVTATTATNSFVGANGLDNGYRQMHNLQSIFQSGSTLGSVNTSFGNATGAPATDLFDVLWSGTSPDAGAITYRNLGTITPIYQPTERNASTITIAPGSTSQSIELYLGVTGLTASTSGLSARYNRTRTVDQPITLVTRTIADPWVSGGFAEVNASTMPGVYRLDIPNEALSVGADDVTVVVRGASGTNGAVMSIKLSSGGLTAAQTASAVWDEPYTAHVTASTFGARTLKTVADNRLVNVGTSHHIESNLHAVVNSTAAASELSGALLHNGTDYIDSNLLGGASTRVFVGRFDLRQTGSDDVDTIEVFTTDTPSFELQLTDGEGNEVPVTGATLGLRILDVASTVVETGTPTVEYGTGGIVRWTGPGTYLAIGCPAGMYRLFIDRTVSGTTTTFGPLQIKVQAQ